MALKEQVVEVVSLAPAIGVSCFSFAGHLIVDWVYLATLVYTVLMIGSLIYRTFKRKDKD